MKIHRHTSEVPEWTQPDLQARECLPDLAAPALLQSSSQPGLDPRLSTATAGQPHKLTRPASWAAHAHLAVLVQEMPAGFSALSMCPVQAGDGA